MSQLLTYILHQNKNQTTFFAEEKPKPVPYILHQNKNQTTFFAEEKPKPVP